MACVDRDQPGLHPSVHPPGHQGHPRRGQGDPPNRASVPGCHSEPQSAFAHERSVNLSNAPERRICDAFSWYHGASVWGQISQFRAAFAPPSYRHDSDSASNLAVEPALATHMGEVAAATGPSACQGSAWRRSALPMRAMGARQYSVTLGRCRHAGRSLRLEADARGPIATDAVCRRVVAAAGPASASGRPR